MPRFSCEDTLKRKRGRMSEKNKRKQLLRAEKQRLAKEIIAHREKAAHSRARELARFYF